MSVHGQPVESVRIISALEKFLKWPQKFHNIILVAHNGRRFPGFIDSLAVFRKKYPGRPNYKQDMTLYEINHSVSHIARKPVYRFSDQARHKPVCLTIEDV